MDPITENNKTGNKGLIAGVVALLLIVGGAFALFKNSDSDRDLTSEATKTGETPIDTSTTTPAITNPKYKDGAYSMEGDYQSPGGAESIQVTLVLKNDIVTEATAVANATRPMSVNFQQAFISGFKQYVVGKNINEVNLTKVSGSSLTPKGFNDAVAKIKIEAQA